MCIRDSDYDLVNPKNLQIVGRQNAREVFTKIVEGAWKNGEPGMVFLDTINKDNHVIQEYGEMIATNPCGEQPLLPNESCNLGSINLAKFYKPYKDFTDEELEAEGNLSWNDKINWARLKEVTETSVRFLDDVIDANYYATPEIEEMTKATRKIGLGIMGFADLLIQLKIPYASDEARAIGSKIMGLVREWSDEELSLIHISEPTRPY